jgi:enamine deaminase RidA (YjgF/YER057c/UK114 family)
MNYSDVVSVQIDLDDMSQFQEVNAIYKEYFKSPCPLERPCRSPSCPCTHGHTLAVDSKGNVFVAEDAQLSRVTQDSMVLMERQVAITLSSS